MTIVMSVAVGKGKRHFFKNIFCCERVTESDRKLVGKRDGERWKLPWEVDI